VDADELRAEIGTSTLRFIANVVLYNQVVTQKLGLGPSDSQFISLLQLHGPLTPGRLAELSGLTTGTVTGVIDRLERAGYVRRERDTGDRRKVLVTQVPEAMAALAAHYRGHGEHLDAVLRRRDAAQLRVIADFLAEVNGSGSASPEAPTGSAPDSAPGSGNGSSGS
jgi:DNA-binding MarR family transcriptional regulator